MSNVTIKYGDHLFYSEDTYDDVCRAIADGVSLNVFHYGAYNAQGGVPLRQRITFYGDPDWVAVELP